MKTDITAALVAEHVLIKRMLSLIEHFAPLTATGQFSNWQFYFDGVDFIRQYADRFHHAKEESVLFEALVANGMPRENSPVAAMLLEHEQGRSYVRAMEGGALQAADGKPGQEQFIADNALAYAALLREHISREDEILYPLAERVLPEDVRPGIIAAYARAEADAGADFTAKYSLIVAEYEQQQ
jgi:hemerythrin-like domain-containing protein